LVIVNNDDWFSKMGYIDFMNIVGLNMSVNKMLSSGCFEQRMAIVEAIKYVDKVVPQTSMNKMDAYKTLKFDALFHGSDWQNSEMYNKIIEEFKTVGVEVVFLPHTDGISSTILREKNK